MRGGDALTLLQKRDEAAEKNILNKQTVQHEAALEAFAVPKKTKQKTIKNGIGYFTAAYICRLSGKCVVFSLWSSCGQVGFIVRPLMLFLTLKKHYFKLKFVPTISFFFFCTISSGFNLFFNQSQELWERQRGAGFPKMLDFIWE